MFAFASAISTFLLAILIITGVHELGHFLIAKLFGIKVIRFSIGFGKSLWRVYDRTGTEYSLALFPIGGYVKLLDTREGNVSLQEQPYAFDKRSVYQRFCVLIAGPVFNFILAILAFWIIFFHGVTYIKPIVGDIKPNSLAAKSGMQAQDEIIAVNQHEILNWSGFAMALAREYGSENIFSITVRSAEKGKPTSYKIKSHKSDWQLNDLRPDLLASFGIKPYMPTSLKLGGNIPNEMLVTIRYGLWLAFAKSAAETWYLITFNWVILWKMLLGIISWHGLGGPISIFQTAASAAKYGVIIYLNFLAILSIGIGVINLLPIPGLDGAQLVYLFYELIRGKPMSIAAQVLVFRLGVILLIIIMLQVILNDLLRIG